MVGHLFFALTVTIRWRLLFPTLCWSINTKSLVYPVYCLQPPTIEHARHSALPEQATFDLDATVQYNCHTGYVTNGFPRAKCLAIEGQASWYGPDISCERKYTYYVYTFYKN
jgi:hypothetical protein